MLLVKSVISVGKGWLVIVMPSSRERNYMVGKELCGIGKE